MAHSTKHAARFSPKGKTSAQIIALLTDFGSQDQYVAAMKGVILSINPAVQIVDITHEVQPQRTRQAGYLLWSVYKFFPKGTVFVNVVDPEVGSKRRIIGVNMSRCTFLAPDNGLLDFVFNEEKVIEEIEVTEEDAKKYMLGEISSTFHGRDVFAPLAAHLSKGLPLKLLGVPLKPPLVAPQFVNSQTGTTHACILHIDHFGNIITNLGMNNTEQIVKKLKAVSIGTNLVSRLIHCYEEAPANTPCLIAGSNGLVEISVKNASAAHLLNATLDTPVKVYWR
jgi:S-adenosyl-L-methionine hydrolase (adenosine-forming)